MEIIGSLVIIIIVGFSNAGGLGGGFLVIPFFFLFFNYSLIHTIENTYIIVFSGSVGNFLTGCKTRHPKTGGPSINYDLTILNAPLLCMGAIVGVNLKNLLPSVILIIVEVMVLVFALTKCINRYIKQRAEEFIQDAAIQAKSLIQADIQQQLELQSNNNNNISNNNISNNNNNISNNNNNISNNNNNDDKKDKIPLVMNEMQRVQQLTIDRTSEIENNPNYSADDKAFLLDKLNMYPLPKMCLTVLIVIIIGMLQVMRGSKGQISWIGIPYCTATYFLFDISIFILCLLTSYFIQRYIRQQHIRVIQKLEQPGLISYPLDNYTNIVKICSTALLAGFVGGMLGIGGGIINTPIWLTLNINPQEVATTSILQVAISSLTATSTVALSGSIQMFNMIYFFFLSFTGSLLISKLVRIYIEENNKQSVLILILIIKITLAIFVLPSVFIWKIATNQIKAFGASTLCGSQ